MNVTYLENCVQSLEAAYTCLKDAQPGTLQYDICRTAVIKEFEFSIETTGKLLRRYLKTQEDNPKKATKLNFKDVIRSAGYYEFFDIPTMERWLIYRDNRNRIAHDYGKDFAEKTLILIPPFLQDAKALISLLKDKLVDLPDA